MKVFDDAALAELGLEAFDFIDTVSEALRAHFTGDLPTIPKQMQITPAGAFAVGTQGMWVSRDLAFFHNLVGLDKVAVRGAPSIYRSAQVLFRSSDAAPLLFVQGIAVSSILPVTMGIIGAKRFANPSSETLTLIGAGLQGRLNLKAFAKAFPLKHVHIYSRSHDKVTALVTAAKELGLEAHACADAEEAVRAGDIVVSSISDSIGIKPFLDLAWLKPNAFLSTIDMFRPWYRNGGVDSSATLVADDVVQSRDMIAAGRIPDTLPIKCSLGEAISEGRSNIVASNAPVVLLQPGCCASLFGMAVGILENG